MWVVDEQIREIGSQVLRGPFTPHRAVGTDCKRFLWIEFMPMTRKKLSAVHGIVSGVVS